MIVTWQQNHRVLVAVREESRDDDFSAVIDKPVTVPGTAYESVPKVLICSAEGLSLLPSHGAGPQFGTSRFCPRRRGVWGLPTASKSWYTTNQDSAA